MSALGQHHGSGPFDPGPNTLNGLSSGQQPCWKHMDSFGQHQWSVWLPSSLLQQVSVSRGQHGPPQVSASGLASEQHGTAVRMSQ